MSTLPCLYKKYDDDSYLKYDANNNTCIIVPAADVPANTRTVPIAKLRLSLRAQSDPAALRRYRRAIKGRSDHLDWDDGFDLAEFEEHFSYNPDTGRISL